MKALFFTLQTIGIAAGVSEAVMDRVPTLFDRYLTRMDKKIAHEGKVKAAQHYKALHACAKAIACHSALPVIPFCKTYEGVPRELLPLLHLLRGDAKTKRVGLTITRSYERIFVKPVFDPTPITGEGKIIPESEKNSFRKFCQIWTQRLGIRNLSLHSTEQPTWINSLAKGPNGPAVLTSSVDAQAVCRDPILKENILKLLALTGWEPAAVSLLRLGEEPGNDMARVGRIALIPEGGGKTRVIAIADYWSQNALRGIHDKLMGILRRLETDGTYEQDDQALRVNRESKGKPTFSYDLTNATDRFPVEIQEILLSEIFGKEVASIWRNVLTQRDFVAPSGSVRWRVGQPLGLLSSWAAFAITHHCLIQYLHWKGKSLFSFSRKEFTSYAVLGDDVAIWDAKVAEDYKDTLERWGIPINLSKSVVSDESHHRVEFAKRTFCDGEEVSGLTWQVLSGSETLAGYMDLLKVCKLRSWELPWSERLLSPSFRDRRRDNLLILCMHSSDGMVRPSFEGNVLYSSLDEASLAHRTHVQRLRVKALNDKKTGMKAIDSTLVLSKLSYWGWTGSAQSVGLIDRVHPLFPVQDQLIQSIMLASAHVGKLNPDSAVKLLPIEYVPSGDLSPYYGNRKALAAKKITELVLKAWYDILTICPLAPTITLPRKRKKRDWTS